MNVRQDQPNFVQTGLNFGLNLVTMVGYSVAYREMWFTTKSTEIQSMLTAGIAPFIGAMNENANYDQNSFKAYFQGTAGIRLQLMAKFLMGIATGFLTGLGAGYLIEHFDADMLESNNEIVMLLEQILKLAPSSTAVLSILGYAAFSLVNSILQKCWIGTELREIENTTEPNAGARSLTAAALYTLVRQSLIAASQGDILRKPVEGVFISAVEQFANMWYSAANMPHPIDELLGYSDYQAMEVGINDDQPQAGPLGCVKNVGWYALRTAFVLSVGFAVNEAIEQWLGDKEDMAKERLFFASGLVSLAGIGAEKFFNEPKAVLIAIKGAGVCCYGRFFNHSATPVVNDQAQLTFPQYGTRSSV